MHQQHIGLQEIKDIIHQRSLRFTQFMKISQNDEATYWLDRKRSVAEDCDNDRRHLCWCTRENLSYTGPAIWRNAFVHNDKQRGGVQLLLHNVQKNYCTTCNNLFLFVTTLTGHHNQPQYSITTNGCHHFHQRKYSHNSRCRIDTQYTAHSIHQKWTISFLRKFQEKTCGCVCPQRCARITG